MSSRILILGLLALPLAGCASTPNADEPSLTVPAAVVYHVDEDRWELVTEQAGEYPDVIRFETVLADGSRMAGLLPPEQVFQIPTVRWKSPNGVAFEDGRWVLRYVRRYVYIQAMDFQRQPLKASAWRRENVIDPDVPPVYAVLINNTTIPLD